MSTIRIAVDVGGTFTDIQVLRVDSGATYSLKTPTTPADPGEGIVAGLQAAATRFDFRMGDVDTLIHGTTIATNAVLERKLARGALVTTAGFEDVLRGFGVSGLSSTPAGVEAAPELFAPPVKD